MTVPPEKMTKVLLARCMVSQSIIDKVVELRRMAKAYERNPSRLNAERMKVLETNLEGAIEAWSHTRIVSEGEGNAIVVRRIVRRTPGAPSAKSDG